MGTTMSSFPVLFRNVYDNSPIVCVKLKPTNKQTEHCKAFVDLFQYTTHIPVKSLKLTNLSPSFPGQRENTITSAPSLIVLVLNPLPSSKKKAYEL